MALIGVLALQGDFKEHMQLLASMGAKAIEVRNPADLQKCSALIIPGGESTTISGLMRSGGLDSEIKKRVRHGMPFYGTCAGAIVAARKIPGEERFKPLGLIDIEVARNAYGRQVDSFEGRVEVKGGGSMTGVFIRAPVITKTGKKVEVLATLDGKPVLVKQGRVIAGTFHPEIEGETLVHKTLLRLLP